MDTVRKRRQQGNHGVRHGLSRLRRNVSDEAIAGCALVEGDQCLLMSCADHGVSLPVAKAGTCIHDGRALLDRHLIGNGASPLTGAISFLPGLLATQGSMQGATPSLVGIDALVDRLVADAGLPIGFEVAGDLFRAPGPFSQARMRACENSCACLGR